MNYSQDITLDLNTNSCYSVVNAKQGDANSRIIRIFITENGNDYIIPANATAAFRLKKPDGKAILNEAIIDYNTNSISVTLTGQALSASGRGYADIILYGSSQEILSTVSFILIIMSAPDVVDEIVSSNEFTYLQTIVDNANIAIHESEAWANGTRDGIPVQENSFEYQIYGSAFTCEIDENIFREKVGIYPGKTSTYKFTYNGVGWLYTDEDGTETSEPVDLNSFGITIFGLCYETNSIRITVTDSDLQYKNNAKYWAEVSTYAKQAIDNLDISTTILSADSEPSVDKYSVDDITVVYSSSTLGTITINNDLFLSKFNDFGNYTFSYTNSIWQYNGKNIDLTACGINYTGTPLNNDYIIINYIEHKHFNFNIPRGLTGDVNFVTFQIDPDTGLLYMYKPDNLTQVDFEIIQNGNNRGCLGVKIYTGGNN